jgi:uncharacterized protein with PIN domain
MGSQTDKKSRICPYCHSPLVHRSRKRSMVERAVSRLLFIEPYRCFHCDRRFFGLSLRQWHTE